MATPKWRTDKDNKDSRLNVRRTSLPEEGGLKDILREIRKISEKQDQLQNEVQMIAKKQDLQQKTLQEELADLKKEWRGEMGAMKKGLIKNSNDINELKIVNRKNDKMQTKLQEKMESMEERERKLEKIQEKLEFQSLEYQLRYRNIQEEEKENIGWVITQITAKILQCTEQEACGQIDRVYRIQSNFTKKNKVIKDVMVHFLKKTTRDEVLRKNASNPIWYKERKAIILKEYPKSILNRRRKYYFLTDELKRRQIKYRWEKYEGLMATYKDDRIWITSEDEAKDFYRMIKKDLNVNRLSLSSSNGKNPKETKKRRFDSPKDNDPTVAELDLITDQEDSDMGEPTEDDGILKDE
ncbi:putative leucine-rich repeat-containing protein DDB_G0290503 [Anolis carolinensis]|uniref:putative leucine-rich repeat-containing protein DDB_G0290503 n=1 Tax=Anolis carolinensis TaxID=28377 RepID=UPI002F2B767D